MSIVIKEVTTKKQMSDFVQFANRLYKNCPYYCPTLDRDEYDIFNKKKNPVLQFSDFAIFLAYNDNEIVGRVVALINKKANERWHCKKVRFGWIDFINDQNVCNKLLDTVAEWGKKHDMEIMNGPVGFTDFDKEGALIEGYDYLAPMVSLYNFPYYITCFEKYGLKKDTDWIEFQIYPPAEMPERWIRINEIAKNRSKLNVVKIKNAKELSHRYPNLEYFDVLDKAYSDLYNYQPMTHEQKVYYSRYFIPLLNFDFVTFVENERNECVGVGIGMPDLSEALKKCNGKLFPLGWYYLLKALKAKKMEVCDLLLIGIRPDYQNKGVTALLFNNLFPIFKQYGIKKLETTSILETNLKNQANFLDFDHIQHKRRRAYIKELF